MTQTRMMQTSNLNREIALRLADFAAASDLDFLRSRGETVAVAPGDPSERYLIQPQEDRFAAYGLHDPNAAGHAARLYRGASPAEARLFCDLHRCLERASRRCGRVALRPEPMVRFPDWAPDADRLPADFRAEAQGFVLLRREDGLLHLFGAEGWIGRFELIESAEIVTTVLRLLRDAGARRSEETIVGASLVAA